MEYKNILITGGCGFLGQYLTNDLLEQFDNINIKLLDLKLNPHSIFDFGGNGSVNTVLDKDICDYNSIKTEFADIDLVIHTAGMVSFALKDAELLARINVDGTVNVLRAAAANGVGGFLHISSVAALGYSDDADNPVDETFCFDWDIARKRKKYYMLTKYLADEEVKKYSDNGMETSIVFPGLMFGPGDVKNSARLIKVIAKGRIPFNMPGGTNIIDVRDVSKGVLAVLKRPLRNGDYLLSGSNLKFAEINEIIAKKLSVKAPALTLPRFLNEVFFRSLLLIESITRKRPELTADNLDSAFKFRYFSNAKAGDELGWAPAIGFERTIEDTIKWMGEND